MEILGVDKMRQGTAGAPADLARFSEAAAIHLMQEAEILPSRMLKNGAGILFENCVFSPRFFASVRKTEQTQAHARCCVGLAQHIRLFWSANRRSPRRRHVAAKVLDHGRLQG
jgi:hypothetical protein